MMEKTIKFLTAVGILVGGISEMLRQVNHYTDNQRLLKQPGQDPSSQKCCRADQYKQYGSSDDQVRNAK
jgi:hypothetical protein